MEMATSRRAPIRRVHPGGSQGALALLIRPGRPLVHRYDPQALDLLPAAKRDGIDPATAAWDVLYRLEPDLYDRLIAGERIHPAVLDRIPAQLGRAVEVGAGTGRLTAQIAPRCDQLLACEPVAPMRARLRARLFAKPTTSSVVVAADMCDLPVADGWADAVLTCSVLTPHPDGGGLAGLAELERVCRRGGQVIIVWPHTPQWLVDNGYHHEVFLGDMVHEFSSVEEAVELATIFYPDRTADVARLGSRFVPYEMLGVNAPRDIAWKVVD
jgi:SAM-dependent methyltransferase